LHSAAATGNVGLAEYALDHGQPINSVLDGVLPLHAACAGGNVQVVKLLVDRGADVNAPRSASFLLLCSSLTKFHCSAVLARSLVLPPYVQVAPTIL
jgi:ankyrin repeat protein